MIDCGGVLGLYWRWIYPLDTPAILVALARITCRDRVIDNQMLWLQMLMYSLCSYQLMIVDDDNEEQWQQRG